MRAIITGLAICVWTLEIAAGPRGQPSVQDVLAHYASAIGGRDSLSKVSSRVVQVTSGIRNQTVRVTMTSKPPINYVEVIEIPELGQTVRRGFDGKAAWSQAPDGSVSILQGTPRAQLIDRASAANLTELFPERWPTSVTLLPERMEGGRRFFVIHIEPADGKARDLLLDRATYLPVKTIRSDSAMPSTTEVVSAAKGPKGEFFPQALAATSSGSSSPIAMTVTSIQDDVPIDDAVFGAPRGK